MQTSTFRLLILGVLFGSTLAFADSPEKAVRIPTKYDFVRSLDLEGGVFEAGKQKYGSQYFRFETRYLDPDENAFVGLITTISRFNQDLRMGDPNDPALASFIWNWGAAIGFVRGKHLWALDLMGASLGEHIAFGPTAVGEHNLGKHFKLFHRTTIDMFLGDTVLDSNQGLQWFPRESVGLSIGYRIFAMKHANRNGPSASLLLHFNIPKLPFIFPSIG